MNRIQTLRSSVARTRPAVGSRAPGELYANFPDLQLGVIDPTQTPRDLIAVRYFSPTTVYDAGDFVVYTGLLYRALVTTTAGWTPAQWDLMLGAGDAAGFLPLTGGTLTGNLDFNVPAGAQLNVSGGLAYLILNATPAANLRAIFGQTNGSNRWTVCPGDTTQSESGGNTGSNFSINSYTDAGGVLATPLAINRATGVVTIPNLSATQAIGDNRIINGDMRIDQRNNGVGGTASEFTVDRWTYNATQTGKGQWGQNIGGLSGFPYFLTFTSSSAYPVIASDGFIFYQPIEADMVSDFAWGTASAQPVTLSFWVVSSLTGTFGGSILNYAQTRSYPFTYSIPTANTWTKVALTIPGDTAGTWVMNGNAGSMYVMFSLGCGSAMSGPARVWAASGPVYSATGAVSVVGTNGASFGVTGVKLEIGSVATPFNRQSLAKSMADCERYFRWLPFNMRFMATAGAFLVQSMSFSVMRASPTIGPVVADPNTTPVNANAAANEFSSITPYSVDTQLTPVAVGDCYVVGYRASASAEL